MGTTLSIAQAMVEHFFGLKKEECSYQQAIDLLRTTNQKVAEDDSVVSEKVADMVAAYLADPVGSETSNYDDLIERAQATGKTHIIGDVKAMLVEAKEVWGKQETPEPEAKPALVTFPDESVELSQPDADPVAFDEYIEETPAAEFVAAGEEATIAEMVKADKTVADVEAVKVGEPGPLETKALEIAAEEAKEARIRALEESRNYAAPEEEERWTARIEAVRATQKPTEADAPVELEQYECERCKGSFEAKDPKVMLCPHCQQVHLLTVEMRSFQRASSLYAAYNGFAKGATRKVDDLREIAREFDIEGAGSMKLVELVHSISKLVGLEWDIISTETAQASTPTETDEVLAARAYAPELPSGFTWVDMAKRCKQAITEATHENGPEGLINYWQMRLAQSEAYVEEDWIGGQSYGQIADKLSEYRLADQRKRAARVDIEKEAHGEEAPQAVILDAETIEENGERLAKAALAAGIHGAFVAERDGEAVFQTPENAKLEFYCIEKDLKFAHGSYLAIRKWMKTAESTLTWKISVVRTS